MPFPAPLLMKVGNFTAPLTASAKPVTGVGFKPKAVILFLAGNTTLGAWEGAGTPALGLGLSLSVFTSEIAGEPEELNEVSLFESSHDTASAVRHGLHQKAVRFERSDGALQGEATLLSMDDDGFTLDWLSVAGVAFVIGYIALGGDSLVAKLIKWNMPTTEGTGRKAVTGVGFKPDVVLHMFGSSTFVGSWANGSFSSQDNAFFCIGAMDKAGNEWALNAARAAGVPTDARKSFFNDRAMYNLPAGSGAPEVDAEFLSMDEDGFSLLFRHGLAGWVASLALGGIEARVGTISKPTSNQSQATDGIGFRPKGLILASAMAALGTTDGVLAGFGAGTSISQRGAVARVDSDNVNPAVSLKRTQTDKIFYGSNAETTHADLTSLDANGWTLSWTTLSGAYPLGYVALGDSGSLVHKFDLELNGIDGGWTEVSEDVLLDSPGVSLQYGIAGTGPLDLVASIGTMKFSLNNSEDNSAGKLGFYSPRHSNCRPGFQLGIRVRYSDLIPGSSDGYGKFIGRLQDIEPMPGRYRDRKTTCIAADWFNEAAITKYNAPTQINQRTDQILSTILALVPRQPDSTSFDVADSTFPYALDNGPVERSTVITEIQRLCQSEYGRCYMKGGLNLWGKLRFEKRTARLTPSPIASFDGTMQDLDSGGSASKIKNKAKVTAHPRRVDGAATTVLFAKPSQNNPLVAPLATIRISGKYVDPGNPNARVGGTDMVAPVATTDYLMNANADGSGADRTANFTVTAGPPYGANQADFVITNTHATLPGYVTKLQIRGRGLYDYDPLEAEEKNQESIDLIGESLVSLDMPYQSDFSVTKAIAQFLVDTWSSHEGGTETEGASTGVTEISIKRVPRTEAELTALMALEPGEAITVIEELAVVNDVYFIQSVGIKIAGDKTTFDFDLQRALVQNYWALGSAGFSELGQTTVLAPL
jgi:hypothetical protein